MNTRFNDARLSVEKAREALRNGNRTEARQWAEHAASLAPQMEDPWLILAAVASPSASVDYIRTALKINPNSRRARKGMEWAMQRLRDNPEPPPLRLPHFLRNGGSRRGKTGPLKARGTRKQTCNKTQSAWFPFCYLDWVASSYALWRYGRPVHCQCWLFLRTIPHPLNRIRKFGRKPRFQSQRIRLHHLPNLKQRRRRSCSCSPRLSQLKRQRHCPLKLPSHRRTRSHRPKHLGCHC